MAPASVSAATFDIRSLAYLSHVDDNLCCPICHSPLVEPISTSCRHTFCNECIVSALERSLTCPVDRRPLLQQDVSMAPIMITNLVNDLVVLCPNSELGCATSCARYLVDRHLRDHCAFAAAKCSGCDETVLRKDAAAECMHQEVECEHCAARFRKMDAAAHDAACPQLTTVCTSCREEMPRSQAVDHEQSCQLLVLQCSALATGCPWSGPRMHAAGHESTCVFVRLQPVMQAQADRMSALDLENKALRKKIDILLPPRGSREESDNGAYNALDDQTIQLLTEQEHQRSDLERLSAAQEQIDMKLGMLMMHMNEEMRTKEEIAMMGAAINNIRNQMMWIQRLAMRGQTSEYQRSSTTSGGSASNNIMGPAGRSSNTIDINSAAGRRPNEHPSGDRVKL